MMYLSIVTAGPVLPCSIEVLEKRALTAVMGSFCAVDGKQAHVQMSNSVCETW